MARDVEVLPDLATVVAGSGELATTLAWARAFTLHMATCRLVAIIIWDALFIPLLTTVEATAIVATTSGLASAKAITKTSATSIAKAFTKAFTKRHFVMTEVSLDKSVVDCTNG
jgi:hypothetical protein